MSKPCRNLTTEYHIISFDLANPVEKHESNWIFSIYNIISLYGKNLWNHRTPQ